MSNFDYYLQDALGRHGEKIVIIKIHNNIIEISVRLDFRLLGKFRHFLNKKLGFMEAGTSANARVFWEYADGNLFLMVGEDREMSYCQIWCMAFRPLSLLIARLPACHL